MLNHKTEKKQNNVILGIDPGSTTIGFGIINCIKHGSKPEVLDYGYIDLKNHKKQQEKLLHLRKDLKYIFKKYNPDFLAIENIYFFKNAKTFISVSEAKGVILLTAAEANIQTHEYTPLQVKQTISGYGKSDKKVIEKLIKTSLDIRTNIKPDDSSDALAIALCHYHHLRNV